MKTLITAAALSLVAGAVHACPNFAGNGYIVETSGSQLYSPQSYQMVAGGSEDLSLCGQPGFGYVAYDPDFLLYYVQDGSYTLTFRAESNCDATLLIRDPYGNWFFDDDTAGNLNPLVNVGYGVDGAYSVWVGTVAPNTCGANIIFETF